MSIYNGNTPADRCLATAMMATEFYQRQSYPRQMMKKFIYPIFSVSGLLVICYFLQPIKKGKGLDTARKYELVKNWPDLPKDLKLGNPTGISIDTSQNIVVFHRAGREWGF